MKTGQEQAFNEWWERNETQFYDDDVSWKETARWLWKAAQQSEREACAQVADNLHPYRMIPNEDVALRIAKAIRARK